MKKQDFKDKIVDYVKEKTHLNHLENFEYYTTANIAENLFISRTLASQHLNELSKGGVLIKVISRPVFYIDKEELEIKYNVKFKDFEFISCNELTGYIKSHGDIKKDFNKAIGCDGTLAHCISQIQSALVYPNGGIPILLTGSTSSERQYLAKLSLEFIKNNLDKSEGSKIILLDGEQWEYYDIKETLAKISYLCELNTDDSYVIIYINNISLYRLL